MKQGGKQDKISFQINLNGVVKITVAVNTNQKNEKKYPTLPLGMSSFLSHIYKRLFL